MDTEGQAPGYDERSQRRAKSRKLHNACATANEPNTAAAEKQTELLPSLVIPFVSVGDLGELAAVNHLWRKMALDSFHRRIQVPQSAHQRMRHNATTSLEFEVYATGTLADNMSKCFRKDNPWCHHPCPPPPSQSKTANGVVWACQDNPDFQSWTVMTKREANATVKVRYAELGVPMVVEEDVKLLSQRQPMLPFGLRVPSAVVSHESNTSLVHCSLRSDGSFWMIVQRRFSIYDTQEEEDGYDSDDESTRLELWALLYQLNDLANDIHPCSSFDGHVVPCEPDACSLKVPSSPEKGQGSALLHKDPVLSQRLTPTAQHPSTCTGYSHVHHGQTSWSLDGRVMAVVTTTFNQSGFGRDGPAIVTVFDVAPDAGGIVQRCQIEVATFRCTSDYSGLQVSLNVCGDVVSIVNFEKYNTEGGWAVYDVSGKDCVQLCAIPGCALGDVDYTFFTPDNDFCMYARSPQLIAAIISATTLPHFANRLILHRPQSILHR